MENQCSQTLCISIDNELKFDEHLSKEVNKTRICFKGFVKFQFKHCLLKCMFYSKNANRRTNHLQERALRKVYDDCELTFEKLLEKDGSCAIYH